MKQHWEDTSLWRDYKIIPGAIYRIEFTEEEDVYAKILNLDLAKVILETDTGALMIPRANVIGMRLCKNPARYGDWKMDQYNTIDTFIKAHSIGEQ